jgi:hypothetical protein
MGASMTGGPFSDVDWMSFKEFLNFAQMGFALGVGYSILRLVLAPISLLTVLIAKTLFPEKS